MKRQINVEKKSLSFVERMTASLSEVSNSFIEYFKPKKVPPAIHGTLSRSLSDTENNINPPKKRQKKYEDDDDDSKFPRDSSTIGSLKRSNSTKGSSSRGSLKRSNSLKGSSPIGSSPRGSSARTSSPRGSLKRSNSTISYDGITRPISENFSIFNDKNTFIFGINNNSTDQTRIDLHMIQLLLSINSRDIDEKFRNFVKEKEFKKFAFLIRNGDDSLKFVVTILDGNNKYYDDFFSKLNGKQKEWVRQYQLEIIKNILEEAAKMNIRFNFPCIGSSDIPHNYGFNTDRFHQDNIVCNVVRKDSQLHGLLNKTSDGPLSNVNFYNYTEIGVSTNIEIKRGEEILVWRGKVGPKTIVGVNNEKTRHSAPYVITDRTSINFSEDRHGLNEVVIRSIGQKRILNRILIKYVSFELYSELLNLFNIKQQSDDVTIQRNMSTLTRQTISGQFKITGFKGGKKSIKKSIKNNIMKKL